MVITHCPLNTQAVTYTDRKPFPVIQNAAAVLKIKDMVGIESDPFVDRDKAGDVFHQTQKVRHCHAAADGCIACERNFEIMGVSNSRYDIIQQDRNRLALTDNFQILRGCRKEFQRIFKDRCYAFRGKRLGDILKSMEKNASAMNSGLIVRKISRQRSSLCLICDAMVIPSIPPI